MRVSLIAAITGMLLISACQTMHGFGTDVKQVGEGIESMAK